MGMYTGLRARVTIKPEFRELLEFLNQLNAEGYTSYEWSDAATQFPQYPWLAEWAQVGRCNFIPRGAVCYLDWDDNYRKYDPATGVWEFCCSLKNYQSEIETFFELVFSKIVEAVDFCETQYECDEEPTAWQLVPGDPSRLERVSA